MAPLLLVGSECLSPYGEDRKLIPLHTDEELDFRGRVAEISEAIFSANRDWIPSRIFSASNYSADITDPDEWLEVLAGNQPGHTAVVYESADKQNLYAQVTLWNGGEGNQLTVNTTWTPNSEHELTQQWKDAIVSTLQLPIVQDALVKKGWPTDPSGLPRDDQSLLAYGMVYGQLPVKRIFKNDPLNGYAAALDAGYAGKYPTLVRSGTFAIAPIKTETTYIITGYSTADDKKDWKVGLGIWKGQGQPEDAGVHAENIRLDDLLHSTEYVIHKQTDVLETTNCGWHGKKDGENYCP